MNREQRAERLGWKRVPSDDDPGGWCWLLPHGSTRASTDPILDATVPGEGSMIRPKFTSRVLAEDEIVHGNLIPAGYAHLVIEWIEMAEGEIPGAVRFREEHAFPTGGSYVSRVGIVNEDAVTVQPGTIVFLEDGNKHAVLALDPGVIASKARTPDMDMVH